MDGTRDLQVPPHALVQQCLVHCAGILADHTQQPGRRAERGRVERHVGRTAGAFLGIGHVHDRDRRFRRYTTGVTMPVPVQHDIARDQYTAVLECGDLDIHE